jgi:uncharacterized membrane protein YphA (DoxX/SURF4 family)
MNRLLGLHALLNTTRHVDFLGPLALRLYLAPIFWMAGSNKLQHMESTIEWFGNPEWGLGLPFPALLAWLAALSEAGGAILLLLGLGVRYIAEGANSLFANERTLGAIERLDKAREILREYGHYEWLTENGSFVVLNNGIEFAATYFIMLLVLFFIGAGRYLSVDHWLQRQLTAR